MDISSFASNLIKELSLVDRESQPKQQHQLSGQQEQQEDPGMSAFFVDDNKGSTVGSASTGLIQKTSTQISQSLRTRLMDPSEEDRLELEQQLRERLESTGGEFTYNLGWDDRGNGLGLTSDEFSKVLDNLKRFASSLNCKCTLLLSKIVNNTSTVGHVLIRRSVEGQAENLIEIRIACTGNVDAGKSTLLGVLVSGNMDDGRGRARVNLFKHKHELESGRTSSVGIEMMGFDVAGEQIANNNPSSASNSTGNLVRRLAWEDVTSRAAKILTFLDLAGHEKYLKTTVFGMTGCAPDYVMLIVGSNAGIIGMTKEHLGLALALNVPVIVVITKIDMCPPNVLDSTLKQVTKILKSPGCKKIPIFIKDVEDVVLTSHNFVSERICPVFQVSSVTGEGYNLLRKFLNLLPAYQKYDVQAPVEYQITETFSVPGVGCVVSGTLISGTIRPGDVLQLGPDALGNYVPCQIKTIHRKRVAVSYAVAGQSFSMSLKKIKRSSIRKSMVLLGRDYPHDKSTWEFEAEILVLYHSSTIAARYQAMVHCGNVRQTGRIVGISPVGTAATTTSSTSEQLANDHQSNSGQEVNVIRTGDRALVRFRFIQYPEFMKQGARVLFREGRTRGVGKITAIYPQAACEN